MTLLALILVLVSAFLHALWNLIAKRANGGQGLIWWMYVAGAVLFAPVSAIILIAQRPALGWPHLIAIAGNAIIHVGYFSWLNQGYRAGDLSLVYPLARGSGPLLATLGAIALLGEQPSAVTLAGATLIGVGVLLIGGNFRQLRASGAGKAVAYALLTGLTIAAYTLWDRRAVRDLDIPPLLYLWGGTLGQLAITAPYFLRRREQLGQAWRDHWRAAIAIAVLSPLAYALVLFALTFSPVSSIAPAREISVLIGAVMGSYWLEEGQSVRRSVAAVAMVAGMIGLALG